MSTVEQKLPAQDIFCDVPITPLEALKRARESQEGHSTFKIQTFEIMLDGPMMCPVEDMTPFAFNFETGESWCCSGDHDSEINEETKWIRCPE